jgi:hypothetical protein
MKRIALNFMRLLSLTVILALVVPVMASAQGKANFAGSWAFNAAKSTQPPAGGQGGGGGARMGGGGDFTATQEANLLSVSRTRTGQDGAVTTNVTKNTLDGKETVTTTQRGESKSTATWSADGKTLTIVTKATTPNGERVSTEEWTLTDAKTLTVTSTRNGQDGTPVKMTMVYDKK